MIRNEHYRSGVCISAEIIDLDAGTISYEEEGVVITTRPLTVDEVAAFTPPAPTVTAEERLEAARDALGDVSKLKSTADVIKALAKLQSALAGEEA